MWSNNVDFPFNVNFNFAVDNTLVAPQSDPIPITPPGIGNFNLLDGTDMLLLDSGNLLLL